MSSKIILLKSHKTKIFIFFPVRTFGRKFPHLVKLAAQPLSCMEIYHTQEVGVASDLQDNFILQLQLLIIMIEIIIIRRWSSTPTFNVTKYQIHVHIHEFELSSSLWQAVFFCPIFFLIYLKFKALKQTLNQFLNSFC